MVLVRSMSVLLKALYNRKQNFLREKRGLGETEDKIFAGDSSFPLAFPCIFPRVCLGILCCSCYTTFPSSLGGWIKKPIIWGLGCRLQGAMVLNVVFGPGTPAGDGNTG